MAIVTLIGLLMIAQAIDPMLEDLPEWIIAWALLYDLATVASKLRQD